MPITKYDGRTAAKQIAGNYVAAFLPAVADPTLKSVTTAEADATTAYDITCSIRGIGVTSTPNMETDQFLCDVDEVETLRSMSHSMDTILVQTGDPQVTNAFVDSLVKGSVRYLVLREGKASSVALASGDKVQVVKVRINFVKPAAVTASTSGKFETEVMVSVEQYEPYATIAA